MKKIFAIILILAMLIPFALACDGGDETTTTEGTVENENFTSKNTVKKDWEGETLLVAATAWGGSPGYPWSTMELVIKEGETSGWGEKIDKAVLERTAYIKATYGVDVIWEWASRYNTHDVLEYAMLAGNDPSYDLAMPRAMRVQAIVANGSVYDMANRPYINFNNSYYNQDSVDAYTAKGHTFFVAGDFSTLDKDRGYVLFVNKDLIKEEVENLYSMVKDKKWTLDKLFTYASSVYVDSGEGYPENTTGLLINTPSSLFENFGVKQAETDKTTGEWKLTVNHPQINDIVSAVISVSTAEWSTSSWAGCWGVSSIQAFINGNVLFYREALVDARNLYRVGNMGVVPFPMLNEAQGRYYILGSYQQTVLMCVPKTTSDRNMSDYFVDVLAWTGSEYVMKAYYESMSEFFSSDTDIEIVKEHIVPSIIFDAGASVEWQSLASSILNESINNDENNFAFAYESAEADALETIKLWNEAWGSYTE